MPETPDARFDAAFDGYAAAFRASRDRAHALVDGLTDAQFNWKPAPNSWSVGECLVHLNVVAEGYFLDLDAALAAAPAGPAGPAPLRYGLLGRGFVAILRPGSRPIPTFPTMRPPRAEGRRSAVDPARAVASFDADTDRLVAAVERARGTDAGRVRVRDSFFPLVRLPLAAFLDGLGQHALKHVGQAERVVAHPAFPRPA